VSIVPCNGCTRCCHGDAVRLLPGDDPDEYQTEPHPALSGERMLAHQANRDCIYLGKGICTIHGRQPQMCREMDCRVIAQRVPWTQARKLDANGRLPMAIWRRGRELLQAEMRKPLIQTSALE